MQGVPISPVEQALGLKFHAIRDGLTPEIIDRCYRCGQRVERGKALRERHPGYKIEDSLCTGCKRVQELTNGKVSKAK